MDANQIIEEVKKGKVKPVYFLHGEESYFIDKVVDYFEDHLLEESQKSFNLSVLYGREVEPKSLLDMLYRYPMFGDRQLVILKEAQDFKRMEDIAVYFDNPVSSTVFVISFKNKALAKNTKLYKAIAAKSLVLESPKVYENKVKAYLDEMLYEAGSKMKEDAKQLLVENVGANLSMLWGEIKKLKLALKPEETITTEHIEKIVGVSKEYNPGELTKSLVERNHFKAMKIARYYAENEKSLPGFVVISFMYPFFSKAYAASLPGRTSMKDLKEKLGINYYQSQDLDTFLKNYNSEQAARILNVFAEYEIKYKGIDHPSGNTDGMIVEWVYRILTL